jgi:hypothetical protein
MNEDMNMTETEREHYVLLCAMLDDGRIVEAEDVPDMMADSPDYIRRDEVEAQVNACTVELDGIEYAPVMDLYDLYPLAKKDPDQPKIEWLQPIA